MKPKALDARRLQSLSDLGVDVVSANLRAIVPGENQPGQVRDDTASFNAELFQNRRR